MKKSTALVTIGAALTLLANTAHGSTPELDILITNARVVDGERWRIRR